MPTIKLTRLTVMSSAKLVSVCKENSLKISYIDISKIVIQCIAEWAKLLKSQNNISE
jgi:hypothetical protein